MTITAKHIQNINHAEDPSGQHPEWHGIDQATIARLPQLLERPVVIMDSATVPGDIVVVVSEVDDQGRPIVVSIRPNGTAKVDEQRGPSNFITSVYGRNGYAAWVNQAVRDGRVLYWNKNRSQNLSGKARVQFPAGLTGLASNTIIKRHAGYVKDNIPERRFSVGMDSEGQELSADVAFSGQNGYTGGAIRRELDPNGVPIYARTREEANVQPTDLRALRERQQEAARRLGMSQPEASRLTWYVQGVLCYRLNDILMRGDAKSAEQDIASDIAQALRRFPQLRVGVTGTSSSRTRRPMMRFWQSTQRGHG